MFFFGISPAFKNKNLISSGFNLYLGWPDYFFSPTFHKSKENQSSTIRFFSYEGANCMVSKNCTIRIFISESSSELIHLIQWDFSEKMSSQNVEV